MRSLPIAPCAPHAPSTRASLAGRSVPEPDPRYGRNSVLLCLLLCSLTLARHWPAAAAGRLPRVPTGRLCSPQALTRAGAGHGRARRRRGKVKRKGHSPAMQISSLLALWQIVGHPKHLLGGSQSSAGKRIVICATNSFRCMLCSCSCSCCTLPCLTNAHFAHFPQCLATCRSLLHAAM